MNVMILAAPKNTIQEMSNDEVPFCLLEYDHKPLLEILTAYVNVVNPTNIIYAFSKKDMDLWHLNEIVAQLTSRAKVVTVEKNTGGAVCTALLGIEYINNNDELLIISANELVKLDYQILIDYFRITNFDAGVMYFRSIHPRYAYIRQNDMGTVIEVSERRPISQKAIPGVFWYARGKDFVEAAKNIIRKDAMTNNSFYISSTLNEMILADAKIGAYEIRNEQYMPLKTSRQMDIFETQNFIRNVDAHF